MIAYILVLLSACAVSVILGMLLTAICVASGEAARHEELAECALRSLMYQKRIAELEAASAEPPTYRWVCDTCGRWILTAGVTPKTCPACKGGKLYVFKGGPE